MFSLMLKKLIIIFFSFSILLKSNSEELAPLTAAQCEFYPVVPLGMTDRYKGIKNEQITASSSFSSQTEPYYGRLHISGAFYFDPNIQGAGAWMAQNQDDQQYIQIDLLERKVVTSVATQGRRGAREWVEDYYVYYTDADEPVQWSVVRDKYGEPKLFIGNFDDNTVKMTNFTYPIIARYIRLNPQRWHRLISLRMELFGCKYKPFIANFDGTNWIDFNVNSKGRSLQTSRDEIRFRFRTTSISGLIFHTEDSQKDYFTIELNRAKLKVNINLGTIPDTNEKTDNSIECGSLLDDNKWHEVHIIRELKNINITVDRITIWRNLSAIFQQLNSNRKLSLGGLPSFANQRGISVTRNFIGCIEEFIYNGLSMIRDSQRAVLNILSNETKSTTDWLEALGFPPKNKFLWWGPITTTNDLVISHFNVGGSGSYRTKCPPGSVDNSVLTFPLINSYVVRLKITRDGGKSSLSFSFQFRTFNKGGTLYYQTVDSGLNYVYIGMDIVTGCLEIDVIMPQLYQINYKVYNSDIEAKNGTFADGLWHSLSFLMDTVGLSLTIDGKIRKTNQKFPDNLSFDKTSYIGGGRPQYYSFQGCMRQIVIDGSEVEWLKLDADSRGNSIINGSCLITDYCSPNPCKHEAPCSQNGDTFFCDCTNTGYAGAVCHQSELYSSCSELGLFLSLLYQKKHNITIDLDGSGVLEPISVECDFNDPNLVITRVFHDSMKFTRVDGYPEPGSYKRTINYDKSNRESLSELTRRSVRCEQAISYRCQNSRLLSLPAGGGTSYSNRAWGWWVGRKGQPRFYWGGGVPGLQRCACGVAQECSQNSLTCNCDYITPYPRGILQSDLGLLDYKEDLPVMEVRFGDTGTLVDDKYADFNVGELLCYGDLNFDNTITFRKRDANIELPPLFAENEFDLSFMFRTTIKNAVLMQNIGKKSGHLFEIRLRDGLSLRYAFDVGNGLQILEVISPLWLDNNEWHLVRIERNRKESRLIVDNMKPAIINEPMDISFQYFQFDQNLFIGTSQAYTEGFVGCLSNLKINGVIQDLYSKVTSNSTYGLSRGCVQKCVPNPCLNRGECYEFYDHYECECGLTPYRGYICGREVGGSFNYGPMIMIDVKGRDNLASVDEYIQIGFKTKSKKGILMQLQGEGDQNYIVLKINSNGGITIEFDVGFKRFEVTTNYDIDLTNDQHHIVKAWRNDLGRKWNLQVDQYPLVVKDFSEYLSETSDIRLDGPHTMFIGRNTSMETIDGFDGCMYAAQWNNIFPFRMAFADPPDPRVLFNNESIREYKCGIEEIMPENEPLEIRPSPQIPDNINFVQVEDETLVVRRTIAGVVVSIILVLIVILLMYFCRHFTFEKGDYKTHEAKVTKSISNPDDAIRFGKTGHPDLPNKEFWL